MIYAYYRVSTDKQDFTSQRYGVMEFCHQRGLSIDKEIIDDGISGTVIAGKRNLGKLLKILKSGDTLIVPELSRLGRKTQDILNTCQILLRKKVKVYFVKQAIYLEDTPTSNILITIFSAFSQLERDLIAQRTKEALAKRKMEGMVLGRPKGRKSNHYKWTGKEEKIKALLNKKLTKKEITKKLKISFPTLKKFIDNYL